MVDKMPKNLFKYKIVCANCNKAIAYLVRNKRNAISEARKLGWTFGKYIKCPNCKDVSNGEIEYNLLWGD